MDIDVHVDTLNRELTAAMSNGDRDTERAGRLLTQILGGAARIGALDLLSEAAEEVTAALAEAGQPAEVQLRLTGHEARLVVTATSTAPDQTDEADDEPPMETIAALDAGDGETARFTLRMPDQLKLNVEQAAGKEGISVNTWIVRAIAQWRGQTKPRRVPASPNSGIARIRGYSRG